MGQIIDRSISGSAPMLKHLLPLYLVISLLPAIQQTQSVRDSLSLSVMISLLWVLVSFPLSVLITLLSRDIWLERRTSLKKVWQEITPGIVLQFILLNLRIVLGTIVGLLLFIIPGVIYATNRLLAGTILLLEKPHNIEYALAKSKFILNQESWLSPYGPVGRISGIVLFSLFIQILISATSSGILAVEDVRKVINSSALEFVLHYLLDIAAQTIGIINSLVFTAFYFDLLSRYEGYDLQERTDLFRNCLLSQTQPGG